MIEQIASLYKANYARKGSMTICGCMKDNVSTEKCKHATPHTICKEVRYDEYCSSLTAYKDLYNIIDKPTTNL